MWVQISEVYLWLGNQKLPRELFEQDITPHINKNQAYLKYGHLEMLEGTWPTCSQILHIPEDCFQVINLQTQVQQE
jgi:hypothetical protein